MRNIKLFFIVLLAIGGQVFAQNDSPNKNQNVSETKFEKIFKILTEKPKWLFDDLEICPLENFPKKAVRLKYLTKPCAENAEHCFNKCQENEGNACYSLALLIQEKKGLEQEYSEPLFLRSCRLGIISGCTNRAAFIFNTARGDEKSLRCAAGTFEKACEMNDPWGCTMFGTVLNLGTGVPKDSEKALRVLSKSCKNGNGDEACKAAGELIEKIKESKPKN
jgi:TPR repeat protein